MSQTFRTATALTVCEGADCRRQEAAGRARRRAEAASRLCSGCGDRLASDLRGLPRLYEECGLRLGGSDQPRERTSGGPLPGMPFNTAAAETRSEIQAVLRSWAAVVVAERGVTVPEGTVRALALFLARHADWLGGHQAAADVSEEVARLVRHARRVIDPDPLRRVPIGTCVESDCEGGLTAAVRSRSPRVPAEIVCDADPAHRWMGHEWLQLSRRMAGGRRPVPGAGESTPETEDAVGPAVRWVGAADIARMWGIAPGSVYRHASEQRWRRRSRAGRTQYHDEDVRRTLDGRAAGGH
ncbi:hypothetical protein [Streptomyces sp. NPDC012510]|uniref:hypothetical protein n=1 Tax=Streptomyces sp. NPDC012510 TaxID=3364838 RepID=UPI0036E4A8B3